MRFTPNGLSVISRQRAISLPRSSGVGCVSAVRKPSAPALATADGQLGAADPLHAALHNRVLDPEHLREARVDHLAVSPHGITAAASIANLVRAH